LFFRRSTLQFLSFGQFLHSIWHTRFSVPPINQAIVAERLGQLGAVLDEVAAQPELRERIDLIGDLAARFGAPPGPPTWVLSTGRCGTRALHQFLERAAAVKSYHRGQTVNIGFAERNEMLYRLVLGGLDPGFVRAAAIRFYAANLNDMLYCLRHRRQYCVAHHAHTIFAPLAARLFPTSQFIYLRRNPVKVFESFIAKDQYRGQLEPLYVDTAFLGSPRKYKSHRTTFRYLPAPWPVYRKVVWYVHVTNAFARAFVESIGPERSLSIASEALYAGDADCFRCLGERLAIGDVTLEQFREHFTRPVNAKTHRQRASTGGLRRVDSAIPGLLGRLAQTGRY
jgi:hypothetical protein